MNYCESEASCVKTTFIMFLCHYCLYANEIKYANARMRLCKSKMRLLLELCIGTMVHNNNAVFFFKLLSLLNSSSAEKKKNPGRILVIKSFIKMLWNKIGTADEVESNGLLIAVNLQNFSPSYKKYWNKTKSVLCKKRRFDSLRMLRFLSLCCPIVVTLWYIPGLSILF